MSATPLPIVVEALVSLFLLIGAAFALIGSWGLAKLPDFYMRLHGPSKSTTLGVGGMLMASVVHTAAGGAASLHEVVISLLLFASAPVSAHLAAKAARHLGVASTAPLPPTPSAGEGDARG